MADDALKSLAAWGVYRRAAISNGTDALFYGNLLFILKLVFCAQTQRAGAQFGLTNW
jgi:hypothetical protein